MFFPLEVPKARLRQTGALGASTEAPASRFNDKLSRRKAASLVYLSEAKGFWAFRSRPDRAAGALRWKEDKQRHPARQLEPSYVSDVDQAARRGPDPEG